MFSSFQVCFEFSLVHAHSAHCTLSANEQRGDQQHKYNMVIIEYTTSRFDEDGHENDDQDEIVENARG